jgi:glutamate-1-semialdehyde 2,1-aminomutase
MKVCLILDLGNLFKYMFNQKDTDKPNILVIIQARLNSVRMPKKVFLKIINVMAIEILVHRLKKIKFDHSLYVALPDSSSNDELAQWCMENRINHFRGADFDVLKRFYDVAASRPCDFIIRITADCPFVDPELVEECLKYFIEGEYHYLGTSSHFPDGLDVEVFSYQALQEAHFNAKSNYDREHVTPFIKRSRTYKVGELNSRTDLSHIRITLDEPEDLEVLSEIGKHFGHFDFNYANLIELTNLRPDIFKINEHLMRNEGSKISAGQKLWKRAQKSIAGGNMLLSKRPDMFLRKGWPTYFSKTSGCHVWDLEGNKFTDISLMGVGTNLLGYSHPKVDEAVRKVINQGNLSTLNAPEEVYLAEKLISLHPWSSKAKFARTGGEANAIAIRLARAATGRDRVAFCGYHGWHDWYLSANLSREDNLNNHLLPGLKSAGIPTELLNTSIPFHFNKIQELIEIVKNNNLAAVVMEVMRNEEPEEGFLSSIREITQKNGITLIFDECTSGFRETYGGLHLKYGVYPDLATFGKTLGNGYAITAVLGTESVMDAINTTFVSSTFWTERIGSAAALAALNVMEEENVFNEIISISQSLRKNIKKIADGNKCEISFSGMLSLTRFNLKNFETNYLKTFITKEMLEQKYLASNAIYLSLAHKGDILEKYYDDLNRIIAPISNLDNSELFKLIEDDLATEGFKRLN